MLNTMQIMDPTGHTSVTWTTANATEVEVARATFDNMVERGYQAFRVDERGKQSTRMREFDPSAEEMILIPQLVGG